jgi:hypothetical protein
MTRREGTAGLSETTQKVILRGVELLNVINSFEKGQGSAQSIGRGEYSLTLLQHDVFTSWPGSPIEPFPIIVGVLGLLLPRGVARGATARICHHSGGFLLLLADRLLQSGDRLTKCLIPTSDISPAFLLGLDVVGPLL